MSIGINSGLLSPFNYFGIADKEIDYQSIAWRNGKFDPDELENKLALEAGRTKLYSEDMQHNQVIEQCLTIINPFKQY